MGQIRLPDRQERWALVAACERLIAIENEVAAMPTEQRIWFMSKDGHRDCFRVAHALKRLLESIS